MKCPNCYGKVNNITKKCEKCGFNITVLQTCENKPVKEYRKQGRHDGIFYSKVLPKDISKKHMLLWCGFLGFFGAHNYVVQKFIPAIIQTVLASLFFIYIAFYNILINYFIYTGPMIGAFCFLWTVCDFSAICLGYYKYPVVKGDLKK